MAEEVQVVRVRVVLGSEPLSCLARTWPGIVNPTQAALVERDGACRAVAPIEDERVPDGDRHEGQSRHDQPWKSRTTEPDHQADAGGSDATPPPREVRMAPLVIGHDRRALRQSHAVGVGYLLHGRGGVHPLQPSAAVPVRSPGLYRYASG